MQKPHTAAASGGGSSKSPCSSPGSIPNDESLVEEVNMSYNLHYWCL